MAAADRFIAPLALFGSLYLATFLLAGRAAFRAGFVYPQLVALFAVSFATWVTLWLLDRDSVRIGFAVSPFPDFLTGMLLGAALIGLADLLIFLPGDVRHVRAGGFPWLELVTVFAPAAFHEELLFRGYVYQKLRAVNRILAIALTALVFAALHGANNGITPLAIGNLLLAGVLLALAYEVHRRLWLPIGLHLAWNVASGPILGYPVSGYVAQRSVFASVLSGSAWVTGGGFGVEGGVCVTVVEITAIALLLWRIERRTQNAERRMKSF